MPVCPDTQIIRSGANTESVGALLPLIRHQICRYPLANTLVLRLNNLTLNEGLGFFRTVVYEKLAAVRSTSVSTGPEEPSEC